MGNEFVDIKFPLWTPDSRLKPGTLPFDHFADYTSALRQLVVAVIDYVEDATDLQMDQTVPAPVQFKKLEDGSAQWVIAVLASLLPAFEQVAYSVEARNLQAMDRGIERALTSMNETASKHGYGWGVAASKRATARVAPGEIESALRDTLRCQAQYVATIIRLGGAESRARFEIAGRPGRLSSPISRELAQRLSVYKDFVLTGLAEVDATTADVLHFEVMDAEPGPSLDGVKEGLNRLAQLASPEMARGEVSKFFAE